MLKKMMAVLLSTVLVFSVFPLPMFVPTVKAIDSVPKGYIGIYTADDLYAVRNAPDSNYILMADIDLTELTAEGGDFDTGHGWTPIPEFSGVFDGNGHKIIGMRIESPETSAGLFSKTDGATVTKLTLENVKVNAATVYTGAIVGYARNSDFNLCRVSGKVSANSYVGGLIGTCFSYDKVHTVSECYNTADVFGHCPGGIIGCASNLQIKDCYNTGTIEGNYSEQNEGGIVAQDGGYGNSLTIINCVNLGAITGINKACGAIFGSCSTFPSSTSSCSGCYYLKGTAEKGEYGAADSADTCVALTETMSHKQTFYSRLNFANVWFLDTNTGILHPQLQQLPETKIESISLLTSDAKLYYLQHEPLDVSGLQVSVKYKNVANASVFPVSENMVSGFTSEDVGEVTVTVTFLGKTATYQVQINPLPVASISLNQTTLSLDEGTTAKLTASVSPANATDSSITWSSDDDSVATVDQNGRVNAVAKGTAAITAKAHNGKSATCMVTVLRPATTIDLDRSSVTLWKGDKDTLKATLSPADTTDGVAWSSDNTGVVKVDNTGKLTAVGKGTAIVTASTNRGLSASCSVSVKVHSTGVTLDKTALVINTGESVLLTASVSPQESDDEVTFSSSDSNVALVTAAGRVSAKAPGSATITATTANGKTATCTVTVLQPATGIQLNKTALSLDVSTTAKLTATLTPANTTDTVTYSSSNSSVATVSSDGTVTAKTKGTATITATATSGKTATCTVTVLVPSTGIQLNKSSAAVYIGETVPLSATLTPANSTDTITWTSSAPSIVSVASNGVATAKAKGTATITAATTSGKTAVCEITATVATTSVTLNKTSLTMNKGETEILTATLKPSDTTDTVSWQSDDPSVVSVSSDGKLTAKAKGSATITATATNGKSASCTVTVLVPAAGIQLSHASLTLNMTKTAKLTATLSPADSTDSVAWSSSDAKVATVSSNGTVTGVAVGTATITAKTASGKSVSCTVTVSSQKIPAQSVSLNKKSLSLEEGATATLTATMTPENATDALAWTSSDASVSVENGSLTANYPGTATITVKTESGKSASCTVTVTPKKVPAQSVSLNQVSLTLKAGQTATLTATMTPSNSTDTLGWSSSDASVATVSNGTVTAKKAGTATITVTTESGKKASCDVSIAEEAPIPPSDNWTQSDQFWFANSSEHFRTGRYTISQSDLLKLNEYIKKNYSSGYAQSIINQITAERNSRWGGSCFGMAVASILDYTGQIGFNENFDKGKATLHDVSSPSTNTEVQSAINYYFMGQFIPMTRNANECYQKGTSAWSSGLKRLVNKAKDNQIMLFCYFFRLGGHAIVIKGYNGTDALGNHLLVSYDNRFPNRDVIVKVSADYSSCIINGDEYATAIEYLSDFDAYDKIDIDGPNNDFIIQSAINASAGQEKQGTEISVVADGDLMIQNKEGKNIVIKDGIITSTLDIISTHLIVHSTPEGDAAPPEIVFTVADSDYFTFESSAGTLSASMLTAETFSCVTANNADSAILSTTEGVSVLGDSAEYTVFSSVEDDGCDMFSFSGVANGTANVRYENGSITVSGNTPGVITAGKYSDDEYEEFSFNSTKKTVSIKLVDTTNAVILGDVDGDGNITSADARLALRASVKLEDYAENSAKYLASDVNKDGKIGSDDARLILRASVKLEDPTKW